MVHLSLGTIIVKLMNSWILLPSLCRDIRNAAGCCAPPRPAPPRLLPVLLSEDYCDGIPLPSCQSAACKEAPGEGWSVTALWQFWANHRAAEEGHSSASQRICLIHIAIPYFSRNPTWEVRRRTALKKYNVNNKNTSFFFSVKVESNL